MTGEGDGDRTVLEVAGLDIELRTGGVTASVVSEVGFRLERGQTLGLVGESGSGKTLTSLALMGVLPGVARISGGSIVLQGRDLVGLPPRELQRVRGREIGMVFQDARRSLDPSFRVGEQIAEVARTHLGLGRREAWKRAVDMLGLVGIRNPEERAGQYLHSFSGGMAQRVMIAMAIVCEPAVLIADEPTTALDVTIQAQVLRLLRRLQEQMGLGLLLITHDLAVVAEMADEIAVMYAGQIVEQGDVVSVLHRPRHPYTAGLLSAVPDARQRLDRFGQIPGTVPSPRHWPSGCRFHPRCPHAVPGTCTGEAVGLVTSAGRVSRCARVAELDLGSGVRTEEIGA